MRRWRARAASTGGRCARRPRGCSNSLEIDDLSPDQIVGVLTVGNRQRVEILRALSHDARILIMDEPTAALTESDVTRLFDVVRRLKQRGVGIVYISHRLDEIFAIADRVTVLRDGAYVGSRDVADTNVGELVQMMVGRRLESLFPKTVAPIGAPVLEARDLVRRPLTKGVSLTVRAGEIVGLAGLVGSGRSELAQTLFGMTPSESGEIRLNGESVRIDSPETARATGHRLRAGRSRHAGPGQADERPAQFFARGAWVSVSRRVHRPRGGAADGARGRRAIQRQDKFGRRDRGPALRRQSAEDRARQVARQQSEAPDPR